MPIEKSRKNGTKNAEGRYSTAYRADPDEFMFRSVHDHTDGRNRALSGANGAQERRRGFHVDRDCAGREQIRPFVTTDDVIGTGHRTPVDGTSGHGARKLLDE